MKRMLMLMKEGKTVYAENEVHKQQRKRKILDEEMEREGGRGKEGRGGRKGTRR